MTVQSHIEPLLDAKDVRRMLKVSLPLVYKWAEAGRLPCVRWECPGEGTKKPRTLVRFKVEDVYGFIEQHYRR
jgi:predicted site-specific integrase-resolvase